MKPIRGGLLSEAGAVVTLLAAFLIGGCGGDGGQTSSAPTPLGMHGAELARDCLVGAGFDVVGGPRPRGDRDAPDVELVVQKPGPGAFLAFYKKLERAKLYEPTQAKRAAVQRIGRSQRIGICRVGTCSNVHGAKAGPGMCI